MTATLAIDYAGQSGNGFRLISEGATIDGRSIAAGPVLQVQCSGGTTASPANCFYFRQEGTLFVNADTPAYAVAIGNSDFSDAHNSIKLDHLVVNNASTAAAAGGLQLNYVLDSDIFAVADSAGGAAGLALEQTQFSRISGAGSAGGSGGVALLLENGFNFANTIFAFDMEASPICLGITSNHDGQNSFVSPYLNCTTAVNATASTRNLLINPTYAGNVVNRGPQSVGISVIGAGSWARWQFPAAASYTATGIDDQTILSSFNAPGAALAVTLPSPAAVNAGWAMGFVTDNGKGLIVTAPSGMILSGGKSLSSVTLGPGNYEYLQLESDGSNFRVVTGTRNTLATNGLESRDWPGNWLYPSTPGYAAQLGDNGAELLSFATATLTAAYKYNLAYLRRGVYGTPIGAHSAGASFARFGPNDPSLFKYVYPQSFIGNTIEVKLPAFNIFGQAMQSLAGLTPTSYTLTGDGAVQGPAYVSGSWPGSPGAGQVVERYIFATPVTFPAGLGGSYGTAGTAAALSAGFTIARNGSAVGTMTFAAGAASASFAMASAASFAAGDVLTIAGPSPADAALANLAWTLAGTL